MLTFLNSTEPRPLIAAYAISIALAALFVVGSAEAQSDDRIKRAQAIGKVSWYNSVYPDELRKELAEGFKQKTKLDVTTYVGGTGQLLSRLATERKTSSFGVDVLSVSDRDALDDLIRDKVLRPYTKVDHSAILPAFKDPAGNWYGFYYWTLVLQYNTNAVTKSEAPKSWEEIVDPKWKGKLAISDPARSGAGLALIKVMVHEKGWSQVERLMRNDPLVVAVGPGVDQAVVKGERQVGATVSSYASETLKAGGPAAIAIDEMLLASPVVASVVSEAPNPDGAELFVDYLLSKEAGELFAKYGWFSTRTDIAGPFGFPPTNKLKIRHPIVPTVDSRDNLLKRFNDVAREARGK